MSMAIYKHFKGKYYCTMGESIYDPEKCTHNLNCLQGVHAHFGSYVDIYVDDEGNYYHSFSSKPMTIYKALYDDTGMYVRPSDDFHCELDKVKYPNATQILRFEKVTSHV